MAAPCPTTCPTTAFPGARANFPFEPTFGPTACPTGYTNFPPSWYGFDFPASKTYSSVFNKETPVPCPPTSMGMPVPPVNFPVNFPVERTPFNWSSWPAANFPSTWFNTPFNTYPSSWMNTPYNTYPSSWFPSTAYPTPFECNNWSFPAYSPVERSFPMSRFYNNTWANNTTPTTPFSGLWNTVNSLCNVAFRPSNPIEFYCLTNPIRVLDREGNRCLWLCFDCRGYKPEEITVTLNKAERCIVVEATHDVKEGKEHHVTRKFYRKFAFPETLAKIDFTKCEIKSCLTSEGMLTVECPLPKMTTEEIAKCPIMSRNFTSSPYAAPYNNYYGCPSTCNTTPITTKVN